MEQKKAQTNVQKHKLDNILSLSFNCDLDAHIVRHLRHDIDAQTDDETQHFLIDMSHVWLICQPFEESTCSARVSCFYRGKWPTSIRPAHGWI